jgi:hypothetical protein
MEHHPVEFTEFSSWRRSEKIGVLRRFSPRSSLRCSAMMLCLVYRSTFEAARMALFGRQTAYTLDRAGTPSNVRPSGLAELTGLDGRAASDLGAIFEKPGPNVSISINPAGP